MTNRQKIFLILLLGISLRIAFISIFTDLAHVNYWEYGEIAKNLQNGKGYSLFYFENDTLKQTYCEKSVPFQSAYMPPLYVFFIYPFTLAERSGIASFLIFITQILISSASVIILYKLVSNMLNDSAGLIASLIFAVYPEYIYADSSIGTTSIFVFLVLLQFLSIQKINSKDSKNKLYSLLLFISSGFLVLLRAEAFLLIFFYFLILLFSKKHLASLLTILIPLIFLMPWTLRNEAAFDEFIPFSTSSGQNLYRGNNPYRPGVWMDEQIEQKIKALPRNNQFEIEMNDLFLKESIEYIIKNPQKTILTFFTKIGHLILYNPYDQRTAKIFYLVPWIILLFISLWGMIISNFRKNLLLYSYIIYCFLLAGVFFALPRYQSMFKIALIPFAAAAIQSYYSILKARSTKGKK